MDSQNVISVSWGDHLLFGEGDGKLDTPEALKRRLDRWVHGLGASAVLWRERRTALSGRFYSGEGRTNPHSRKRVTWDDFEVVPCLCHERGMRAYLYVTLFDEGWPLPPRKVREVSYHNAMHYQHYARQTNFSRQHPEYAVINRTGDIRQWGVLCLGYTEVRSHFVDRYLTLLRGYDFDGLFVCLRSQSRPADFADQFGFNEPVRRDYMADYGRDILREDFDLQRWRGLHGEYFTRFLTELRAALPEHIRLAVGIPRGDIIGPPLGNWPLRWRQWVEEGLADDLMINQNSSQCPSMWHQLWPMHRGYGYVQNYLDGYNMPSLGHQLEYSYGPIIGKNQARLYVARQWDERDHEEEASLLSHPVVSGLVFTSFRFDNPEAVKRGDWRA
jgi:hypothetical protein